MGVATTVDNLAETFLAFWALAQDKPVSEQILLWETHYAEPHRKIPDYEKQLQRPKAFPWNEVFRSLPGGYPEHLQCFSRCSKCHYRVR